MISPQSYHALQFFSVDKALPDDELPDCLIRDFTRIKLLLEQGFIFSTTLCPPNKEEAYPRGLAGYYLSAKGVDAISEFERANEEQIKLRKHHRIDLVISFFSGVLASTISALIIYWITQ